MLLQLCIDCKMRSLDPKISISNLNQSKWLHAYFIFTVLLLKHVKITHHPHTNINLLLSSSYYILLCQSSRIRAINQNFVQYVSHGYYTNYRTPSYVPNKKKNNTMDSQELKDSKEPAPLSFFLLQKPLFQIHPK